jgi:amino acid transporter
VHPFQGTGIVHERAVAQPGQGSADHGSALAGRGVAEGVWTNVVLTCVELTGLLIVIFVGLFALTQGKADFSQVVLFDDPKDKGVFLAVTAGTTLAFFAMVGFEDSVNMAEETHNPSKIFPKILLAGLLITGLIYVLVSISAVTLVPTMVASGSRTSWSTGPGRTRITARSSPAASTSRRSTPGRRGYRALSMACGKCACRGPMPVAALRTCSRCWRSTCCLLPT